MRSIEEEWPRFRSPVPERILWGLTKKRPTCHARADAATKRCKKATPVRMFPATSCGSLPLPDMTDRKKPCLAGPHPADGCRPSFPNGSPPNAPRPDICRDAKNTRLLPTAHREPASPHTQEKKRRKPYRRHPKFSPAPKRTSQASAHGTAKQPSSRHGKTFRPASELCAQPKIRKQGLPRQERP